MRGSIQYSVFRIQRWLSRWVFAFCLPLALMAPRSALGATITGPLQNRDTTAFVGTIIFRPVTDRVAVSAPTIFVYGDTPVTTAANGNFTNVLSFGNYNVFAGKTLVFKIAVPNDTNTYTLISLISTAVLQPSDINVSTAVSSIAAGKLDITNGVPVGLTGGSLWGTFAVTNGSLTFDGIPGGGGGIWPRSFSLQNFDYIQNSQANHINWYGVKDATLAGGNLYLTSYTNVYWNTPEIANFSLSTNAVPVLVDPVLGQVKFVPLESLQLGSTVTAGKIIGKHTSSKQMVSGTVDVTDVASAATTAAATAARVLQVANVAAMQALTGVANNAVIVTAGCITAGDGGGATFYYSASSSATTNLGAIFAATGMGTGRYLWNGTGDLNVRMFGALGDGITDDTAAIQAAINAAEAYLIGGLSTISSVLVPPGVYRVSSLELTNASIEGTKWSKQTTANNPTIKAISGQTNGALLHVRKSTLGNTGPTIKNLTLLGLESNHRTAWTISAVSSRTSFTVNTNNLPTVTAPNWPFTGFGFCLFYDTTDSFSGHGLVSAINATTGVVTLTTGWDNYAATGSAGANMPVGWKVIFAPYTTETGPDGTVSTTYDYSGFGQSGIDYQATVARLENVYINGFCAGVRNFGGSALQIEHVWSENNRFAGYGEFQYGFGGDLHANNFWIQGIYYPDIGWASTPLLDGAYRFSAWGIWGMQSAAVLTEQVVAGCVNAIFDRQGNEIHYNDLLIDSPTLNGYYNNGSSNGDGTVTIGKLQLRAPGSGFGSYTYRQIPTDRGAKSASGLYLGADTTARHISIGQLSTSTMGSTTASNSWKYLVNAPNGYTNTLEIASLGGIAQGYTNWANIGGTRLYHPQLISGYSTLTDTDYWLGGRNTEATNWSIVTGGARSATFGPTVNSNLVTLYNSGTIYNAAAVTNNSTLLQTGAATLSSTLTVSGAVTNTAQVYHNLSGAGTQEVWDRPSNSSVSLALSGGYIQYTTSGDNAVLWTGTGYGVFANNTTISTAKSGGILGVTYDNTRYIMLRQSASSGVNGIQIGGGSASWYAATDISFYVAAATNTTTGTQVLDLAQSVATFNVPINGTLRAAGTAPTCTGATIGTGAKNNAGFVTATSTGTSTVVMTFSTSAATGWAIAPQNNTTANMIRQISSTTTTATFSGVTVSGDVISYIAVAY